MTWVTVRRILVAAFALAVALVPAVTRGQAPAASAKSQPATGDARTSLRTPDGLPDLQGVWDFRSGVPLERPVELAGEELTEAEALEFRRRRFEEHEQRVATSVGFKTGYDTNIWWDNGWGQVITRTSLVVDPPDGRLPSLTPAAEKLVAEARRANELAAGPEDRMLTERCMFGFNAGPPIVPSDYNNNLQIFVTPDHVVLFTEMNHDARVVPLDGRSHLPSSMRQWAGDSRGRWEGETLVVETRSFLEKTAFFRAPGFSWRRSMSDKGSDQLHVTERFSRLDAKTLLYEFTLNDPGTYTAPWTARVHMKLTEDLIYEYACHEGNYGMFGILSGTRADERGAAKQGGQADR